MAFTKYVVLSNTFKRPNFALYNGEKTMKRNKLEVIALAVALGVSVLFSSCGSKNKSEAANGDELSGEITLSGAFALYPLAVQWADEFKKLHPDVTIDISAGGAGKGMTDALAGVVDLGMVSREVDESEVKKGAVAFAVAKDAVVPTINANNKQLKSILASGLSRDEAIGLWITGKVKTWGQVAGTSDKTGVVVYTRSDACGAADTWAKWLGKKQEDLLGTCVFGDPGVAAAVQKDANGIGLNNIGYVYDSKTKKPNAGILVIPIDVNNDGKITPDENFYDTKNKLVKAIADGKYPSPPARDLYLVSKGVPEKPVVKEFLKYILTKGQAATAPQGYIGISKDRLQQEVKKLGN